MDPVILFALRILILITPWAFIGVAVRYILHERRTRPVVHPIAAALIRLDANGQPVQGVGARYQLGSDTTVWMGRNPNCVVRIDNEFVSQQHARILWRAEQQAWWIEDDNSRNGTLVNEVKVMRSVLNNTDIITIGGVQFQFATRPAES